MKQFRVLFALAALVGVLFVSACSGSSSGSVTTVDPATYLQTVSQPGVTVIDVRTPAEYAAGHLANAINMDVEGADFANQIGTLDKTKAYAVYCHSGRRSAMAADAMAAAGFTNVTNLKGGIADLQAAGGQIVTS